VRLPHEVLVVVRRGGQFLVLRRSERQGGYWHCVAGGVERGETPADAAARELREETALDVAVVDLRRRYAYPLAEEPERLADYAPGVEEVVVDCFLADAPDEWEPALDWEHVEYRWCSLDEAVELLRWPEPREVLAGI
jgi:dATP pyrophosphohydrolase